MSISAMILFPDSSLIYFYSHNFIKFRPLYTAIPLLFSYILAIA